MRPARAARWFSLVIVALGGCGTPTGAEDGPRSEGAGAGSGGKDGGGVTSAGGADASGTAVSAGAGAGAGTSTGADTSTGAGADTGAGTGTGTGTGTGGDSSAGSGGAPGCSEGTEQCVGGVHQVCQGGAFVDAPCAGGEVCVNGACEEMVCTPGEIHCKDDSTTEVCNVDGTGYDAGAGCGLKEQCFGDLGCISLCEVYALVPSSVGCSFFALNMDNFDESHEDAVTVGNTSSTLTAVVDVYGSYGGVEAPLQSGLQVPPLSSVTILLPNAAIDRIHGISMLRAGGAFRIASDTPIIAYQHSPLTPYYTNDASCLLPEAALGTHYFVPSYYDALGAPAPGSPNPVPYPSYFDVIGTVDGTTVTVTAPVPTEGGQGVPAMAAGQATTFTLNRYDTLQVVNLLANPTVAERDVMGTEITATAPVAVFGGVECAQVPAGYTFCDHLEEQAIPVRSWGMEYVAAHAPARSPTERYYWRVMAQEDGTTVDASPPQAGFPRALDRGQFYEFWSQESFVLTGDRPFAAFQYITGQDAFGAGTGDPAMITAVPVEQFLTRYVLLTPSGYSEDYVQIVRTTADDVEVDGMVVPANLYSPVGSYTVADVPVTAGAHAITSASPFGIVGVGYTGATSYGYPGGMGLGHLAPD